MLCNDELNGCVVRAHRGGVSEMTSMQVSIYMGFPSVSMSPTEQTILEKQQTFHLSLVLLIVFSHEDWQAKT